MTDKERLAAYQKAITEASKLYGYDFAAQLTPRMVGPQLQAEAQLVIVPLQGWKDLDANTATLDTKDA